MATVSGIAVPRRERDNRRAPGIMARTAIPEQKTETNGHRTNGNGAAKGDKGHNGNGNGHGSKALTSGYHQLAQGQKPAWRGLTIERRFTRPGVDPYDTVEWDTREAVITNEHGKAVFEQRDLEVPKAWSQLATQVVASKYFRGTLGTPERERSVKQMLDRVANTITDWGIKDAYFATDEDAEAFRNELKDILLKQRASFNSPVWFNVGIDAHPQCSACFINSVDDTMESILTLAKTEGMLFKFGSGTGSNLSAIRSSKEFLAGGGTACNLASLNLMTFVKEDGEFDPEAFRAACRVLITAQEILVDNSSYPTKAIEKNSHAYRPLGLGYANLGALLMSRGLPYDSD